MTTAHVTTHATPGRQVCHVAISNQVRNYSQGAPFALVPGQILGGQAEETVWCTVVIGDDGGRVVRQKWNWDTLAIEFDFQALVNASGGTVKLGGEIVGYM